MIKSLEFSIQVSAVLRTEEDHFLTEERSSVGEELEVEPEF
jgi:hypothetical protein